MVPMSSTCKVWRSTLVRNWKHHFVRRTYLTCYKMYIKAPEINNRNSTAVPFKWRQICRNCLIIIWTLDKGSIDAASLSSTCTRHICWMGVHHCGNVSNRIFTRTRHTWTFVRHCGKVLIQIFDLQKVGHGHGIQFLQWRRSMANVKSTNVFFYIFILQRYDLCSWLQCTHARTHACTHTETDKPRATSEILQICLKTVKTLWLRLTWLPLRLCGCQQLHQLVRLCQHVGQRILFIEQNDASLDLQHRITKQSYNMSYNIATCSVNDSCRHNGTNVTLSRH